MKELVKFLHRGMSGLIRVVAVAPNVGGVYLVLKANSHFDTKNTNF